MTDRKCCSASALRVENNKPVSTIHWLTYAIHINPVSVYKHATLIGCLLLTADECHVAVYQWDKALNLRVQTTQIFTMSTCYLEVPNYLIPVTS